MATKEANTMQVLRWVGSHWHWVTLFLAMATAGYRFETQWQEHVDPDCSKSPTAVVCKFDRMEKKMDRIEQKTDQIMAIIAKRK